MRFTRLAAATLLTISLATACGGSKTTTASENSTGSSSSSVKAGSEGGGTIDLGSGGGDFCETARQQAKSFLGGDDKALEDALSQIFDPSKAQQAKASLKAYVQTAKARNSDFIAKAPAELKADLGVIKTASDKLFDAMAKADYDIAKMDTSALSEADTPQLKAASDRLNGYLKKTCGIDLSPTG